ncbi:leucyl aminopeptidase family protein [Terrarubrum flagellatum]|uniref:leucyl aminopeptidase family protein n=1 Tax=Terrirubrum flagellatum TaxID=2895980 RepID=UPI0031450E0A
MREFLADGGAEATPIRFARPGGWKQGLKGLAASLRFAEAYGFDASAGKTLLLPDVKGEIALVLVGLGKGDEIDPLLPGKLSSALPKGVYQFEDWPGDPELAVIAFLLGAYRFERYRKRSAEAARLVLPDGVDRARILRIAESVALGRDLINMPANDMGPVELAAAAQALATRHKAKCAITIGDELLKANFPMIHAVGRGSARAPRLVDIQFGKSSDPKVTLVGKGVVFDTGGLDIKPPAGMLMMKKDMGGAATALAAASMIMDARLPVRLRVLLPIVENAIGGDSFRPGDVLKSRKGLTVEIGNTDAEGRLILADALALADEESPELLIDFATLTGAARVALGPDLPPFFTRSDKLAAQISQIGDRLADPVWRLPLWRPYHALFDSKIADMNNVSSSPFAGSVIAALFLGRFVEKAREWAHFDIFGWTPSTKNGRPEGAEPQTARLVYALVEEKFSANITGQAAQGKGLRRARRTQ